MKRYNVGVVGATGAVGRMLLSILSQRRFPISALRLFASPRSVGQSLRFLKSNIKIETLKKGSFCGIDLVFFAAGSSVSKEWTPQAVESGAVVIDKSSAFRMTKNVPLVVPEVNPEALRRHQGIIASPNCSTIPLVVVLKPLHEAVGIKRVVVTTFQSVSGAGLRAVAEMESETQGVLRRASGVRHRADSLPSVITHNAQRTTHLFPHPIAFNVIPQIPQANAFEADDYTDEEWKMINETRKIMGEPGMLVSPTCVRVPVYQGHSESVNIETVKPLTPQRARALLSRSPGIRVLDNPARQVYPTPAELAGTDEVFVGRIRMDRTVRNGLNLWVVSDNLRKGAALNAVQIAEVLVKDSHRKIHLDRTR